MVSKGDFQGIIYHLYIISEVIKYRAIQNKFSTLNVNLLKQHFLKQYNIIQNITSWDIQFLFYLNNVFIKCKSMNINNPKYSLPITTMALLNHVLNHWMKNHWLIEVYSLVVLYNRDNLDYYSRAFIYMDDLVLRIIIMLILQLS